MIVHSVASMTDSMCVVLALACASVIAWYVMLFARAITKMLA